MIQKHFNIGSTFYCRVIILATFLITIGFYSFAQSDEPFTQYILNKYLINPAVAGAEGITSFNLAARRSWAGVPEAPSAISITGQTRLVSSSRIMKSWSIKKKTTHRRRPSGRVGIGGNLYTTINGRISQTGLKFTYAYHLPIRTGQLSFGLAPSLYLSSLNKSDIILNDPTDPFLDTYKDKMVNFDADFGVFYTNFQYYGGYTVSNISRALVKFNDKISNNNGRSDRTHTLMGGYRYTINREYEVDGDLIVRIPENEAFESEITVKGLYQGNYWVGISYRLQRAITIFFGGAYKNFYLGYSFDYEMIDIKNFGSHEISFGYLIGDKRRKYRWLNRF